MAYYSNYTGQQVDNGISLVNNNANMTAIEKVVGTWFDGRPIYAINLWETFTNNPVELNSSTEHWFTTKVSGPIDILLEYSVYADINKWIRSPIYDQYSIYSKLPYSIMNNKGATIKMCLYSEIIMTDVDEYTVSVAMAGEKETDKLYLYGDYAVVKYLKRQTA